jgi:glutamine amidotransferase
VNRELQIVVVDYGAGNLRSVSRALAHAGVAPLVTEDPAALAKADGVVLPGVGAAGSAMEGLGSRRLVSPLRDYVASGRPLLGVCLGLQVFLSGSDEDGGVECLGFIPGRVVRLPEGLKIPHIGWNQVEQTGPHPIFAKIPDGADFYFVHSYYAVAEDPASVIGATEYGVSFASVLARDNVVATQFHPEKSARDGLQIYQNFVDWVRNRIGRADAVAVPGVTR